MLWCTVNFVCFVFFPWGQKGVCLSAVIPLIRHLWDHAPHPLPVEKHLANRSGFSQHNRCTDSTELLVYYFICDYYVHVPICIPRSEGILHFIHIPEICYNMGISLAFEFVSRYFTCLSAVDMWDNRSRVRILLTGTVNWGRSRTPLKETRRTLVQDYDTYDSIFNI